MMELDLLDKSEGPSVEDIRKNRKLKESENTKPK